MKTIYSFLVVLFLMINTVWPQTINSEFLPSQNIGQLKEGDIIEATIRVWPIENADLSQFKKLEKGTLFNAFYLAQITSLAPSPNNADVVELKGLFIVKSTKVEPIYALKYNESLIELRSGDVKVTPLGDKSQDFYILDQSLDSSKLWMILTGAGIVLLILGFVKRQKIKEFLINLKPDQAKKDRKRYDELFRVASKREDFERLYSEKNKWLALLTDKAPAHLEFLKTLNQYQFKKDWSNEELNEVRASFDIIRRSFEK